MLRVFSAAWLQSHVFIFWSTAADSVRRSSALFARSPPARASISYSSPIHLSARLASG